MPIIELSLTEIPLNTPIRVSADSMPVVVVRTTVGVFAYEDKCPHAFWPLSNGEINQGVLECPGHGWEFSVETGKCLNAPAYCLNAVAAMVERDKVRLTIQPIDAQTAATPEPTLQTGCLGPCSNGSHQVLDKAS
jgi:nitrite reductase/ring-hydroxylating ferredoxin subunit